MKTSVILKDEKLKQFCKELNIDNNSNKIVLTIENNSAKYYLDDTYYELDLEIAKKYM